MIDPRTDRRIRVRDITLADISRVCRRYGIRVAPGFRPAWSGPWRLDNANRVWARYYGDDGQYCVERSLDAD